MRAPIFRRLLAFFLLLTETLVAQPTRPDAADAPTVAETGNAARVAASVAMPGGWIWHAPPEIRFRRGDDPRWSARDLDDSEWETILPNELPAREGIFWIRFRIRETPASGLPGDGLAMTILASYDVFWDGHRIGSSGSVGSSAETEQPGRLDTLFQVPGPLTGAGEHVVALRMSSFHAGFPAPQIGFNYGVGNFAEMLVTRTRRAMQSLIAVGGLLGFAVAFGVAWLLVDRRPAVGMFAGAALAGAGIQGLQAWRWLYDYSYAWHYPRVVGMTLLVALLGACLIGAVLFHVRPPRWRGWLLVASGCAVVGWNVSSLYPTKSFCLFLIALGTSAAAVGWGLLQGRRQLGALLAGLVVSLIALVVSPADFAERYFLMAFGGTLAGALTSFGLQWRDERRTARQAQLLAARLEIELLKKHIQPHFLMNTLTSLMEVVESDPRQAVTMIEALAAEFRILARVSGERLIALEEELALCSAHLQIMSLRRDRPCTLEVVDVDPKAPVPPALFHTLIENGLTHFTGAAGAVRFVLRGQRCRDRFRYEFLAPASKQAEEARSPKPALDGTGLRYVKARLEESFPSRWTLNAAPVAGAWRTVIEIADPS